MDGELASYVRDRYPALLRRAVLLVGDRPSAEDLVQDTLAKLWRQSGRGPVDNRDAWVRRVMVNTAISGWRRRSTRDAAHRLASTDSSHVDASNVVDEQDRVWRAILQLPTRQRAVLVLRYYEDLTEDEICTTLDVTAGTVRSQTAKARANLRALLQQQEGAAL